MSNMELTNCMILKVTLRVESLQASQTSISSISFVDGSNHTYLVDSIFRCDARSIKTLN